MFHLLQLRHGGLSWSRSPSAPCSSTTARACTRRAAVNKVTPQSPCWREHHILPGPRPQTQRRWDSSRPFLKVGWRSVTWVTSSEPWRLPCKQQTAGWWRTWPAGKDKHKLHACSVKQPSNQQPRGSNLHHLYLQTTVWTCCCKITSTQVWWSGKKMQQNLKSPTLLHNLSGENCLED